MEIQISIPGKPIAKKRPKFYRRGSFVGAYNAQETEEGKFQLLANSQIKLERPISNPICIDMLFYMLRPKSHFGTGRNKEILKKTAPYVHFSKPDIDNLEKMVYDCLNQMAWMDDSLIVESRAKKVYSRNPRTEITIVEVDANGHRI